MGETHIIWVNYKYLNIVYLDFNVFDRLTTHLPAGFSIAGLVDEFYRSTSTCM